MGEDEHADIIVEVPPAEEPGRVCALAVALGIGTAVANTSGIAFAEPADSTVNSATETTPDSASGPQTPAATDAATATEKTTTAGSPSGSTTTDSTGKTADGDEESPSRTTLDLGDGVVISSSGGMHTSTSGTDGAFGTVGSHVA